MSTLGDNSNRRVIPRWRLFTKEAGAEAGPLPAGRVHQDPDENELNALRHAWKENQSSAFAADFVGSAVVLGVPELARDAAEFLMRGGPRVSPSAKALAASVLGIPRPTIDAYDADPKVRIREIRSSLSQVPRDPVAWLDLAWEQSVAGHSNQAERAVRTALALAPDHRLILRAATRFYVHLHEPEFAHDLLRRAKALLRDPWLLAAEIATADVAGRTSRNIKAARGMLESKKFPLYHLSELAAAVGSLELVSGTRRKARRLFDVALAEATENSVAQFTWAAHWLGAWEVSPDVLAVPNAYEATTWERFHSQDWRSVLVAAGRWHRDEPFSARPAVIGSGVGISLGEIPQAERLAREGLASNRNHMILLNNLTVALALQDRLDEAVRSFERIRPQRVARLTELDRVTYIATAGLLSYRTGDIERGRELYDLAITRAENAGLKERAATAYLFKVREEIRTGSPDAATLLIQAEHAVKQVPPEQAALIQNLLRKVAELRE